MSVVTEIKSALVVLSILHLAAFLVMVGYRMHTKQYYVSEAAKEAQAMAVLESPNLISCYFAAIPFSTVEHEELC